jgi:histone H3/H4
MFETAQFREQVEHEISTEATQAGLTQYQVAVVDYLQRLAAENEAALMETELRKARESRRGLRDAVASARVLAKAASLLASAAGRNTLQIEDIQIAYRANFCQVWPFCR